MLTTEQLAALQQARMLLEKAGVLSSPPGSPSTEVQHLRKCLQVPDVLQQEPSILPLLRYIAPPASSFSCEQILSRSNRITTQTSVQKIVYHPIGAIVEFPETGISKSQAVAHVFPVLDKDFDPKLNIQYSIWGQHGAHENFTNYLLWNGTSGEPSQCRQFKSCCKSLILGQFLF